jgi:hypothetical protein
MASMDDGDVSEVTMLAPKKNLRISFCKPFYSRSARFILQKIKWWFVNASGRLHVLISTTKENRQKWHCAVSLFRFLLFFPAERKSNWTIAFFRVFLSPMLSSLSPRKVADRRALPFRVA